MPPPTTRADLEQTLATATAMHAVLWKNIEASIAWRNLTTLEEQMFQVRTLLQALDAQRNSDCMKE